MKVKDLIIELKKLDQEQEIFTYNQTIEQDEKIDMVYKNDDGTYYV